jgi:hypothetical protein
MTLPPEFLARFRAALTRALPLLHEGLLEEAAAFLVTGQLDPHAKLLWHEGAHTDCVSSYSAFLLRFAVNNYHSSIAEARFTDWLEALERDIDRTFATHHAPTTLQTH